MSRALAATLTAALIAALALAPGGSAVAEGARGAVTDCSWQRHSKRIVKHVRRGGRPRRVVRIRRWWSCDQVATPTPPTAAPAPGSAPAAVSPQPAAEPAPTAVARLGVKAEEWSLTLSRPNIEAGEAIVELNNQGADPHNLNLLREGDPGPPLEVSEAGSLEHRTARFTLATGTYRLWCSLPEHEEKGMRSTLVVGPSV